jgi:hypothetical protein|tara:strand:- start:549 stop:752 length:204 start_codon:yes stop_codon:yes gene_type:complete
MSEDKKTTKKEIEEALAEANTQLEAVSQGYQQLTFQNQQLNILVIKYEETINLLTARLMEARQQQPL